MPLSTIYLSTHTSPSCGCRRKIRPWLVFIPGIGCTDKTYCTEHWCMLRMYQWLSDEIGRGCILISIWYWYRAGWGRPPAPHQHNSGLGRDTGTGGHSHCSGPRIDTGGFYTINVQLYSCSVQSVSSSFVCLLCHTFILSKKSVGYQFCWSLFQVSMLVIITFSSREKEWRDHGVLREDLNDQRGDLGALREE